MQIFISISLYMMDVPNPEDLLLLEHLVRCFSARFSPNEPELLGMEVTVVPQPSPGADLCQKLLGAHKDLGRCSGYRGK